MTDAELAGRLREHAYLEGDFVLRSGRRSRYYLDKYRFETRPGPPRCARRADRAATRRRVGAPKATPDRGPELGAVALAAAASLVRGLPFLIVRKEAKGYGTERRIEGEFDAGEEVCLVEDVVTTGGAAERAPWRRSERLGSSAERRSAWSTGRRAGRTLSRARRSASCPLFRAQDILPG